MTATESTERGLGGGKDISVICVLCGRKLQKTDIQAVPKPPTFDKYL